MKNHDIFEQTLGPKEFNSEDLKDKLKNQLRELDIFASSIENSKITTPSKVVPSSVNKSFTNLNWPPQTPKESSREKSTNPGSVSDSLKVMQEGIDLLSRQVQNLESVIQKKDLRHVLSRVKDEIIADLRSTSNKSYAFDFDEKFAEAFERSMND